MRTITHGIVLCILVGISSSVLHGQYFGERVLEKSFEQTEFFFTPSSLTPLGIGGFHGVAAGFFDDRLSWLAVNPAFFSIDSLRDHYAYLDFRSVSQIRSPSNVYYPMYDYRVAAEIAWMPYPRYFYNERKELRPVFSGAYLTRPLPSALPDLFAGITYQMIFQDDKYYPIPHDIYRSVLGYDYSGARTAAENFPIVDRYKGSDDIHHLAHLVSFFSAYNLTEDLQIGLKLGRTSFTRDGSFGSQNLWDGYYNPNYRSLWGNMESRSQEYSHWDLTAGVRFRFSESNVLGATLGYLTGNAKQNLGRTDTSFYGTGTPGVGPNWSYYMRSGLTEQDWEHNGRTMYGGLQLNRQLSPTVSFNLLYGFSGQNIDIDLASSISDTSYNSYRYRYQDTLVSRSEGYYRLIDARTGGGTKTSSAHRFLASVHWKPQKSTSVSIGLQLEFQRSETRTDERVLARRGSHYSYSSDRYGSSWFDKTVEDKDLRWTFNTNVTTLQIPIVFQWQMSDWFHAMVGVSRTMASWEIEDVTLALFRLRDRKSSGGNEKKENFGERYTMPKERVSDVRTTAILGLTAIPSRLFNIRLLMTPNIVDDFEGLHIQDLRSWLSFQLTL